MKPPVQLCFAASDAETNRALLATHVTPGTFVVSEFAPPVGQWIPFHVFQTREENAARIRAAIDGAPVERVTLLHPIHGPYAPMSEIAAWFGPVVEVNKRRRFGLRRLWRRLARNPLRVLRFRLARRAWAMRQRFELVPELPVGALQKGISVIIPSRNGRKLLDILLPPLLAQAPDEVIVVDNGSDDGTASWLASQYPAVRVITHNTPLSFARATNSGLLATTRERVCLLNNDMIVEPAFLVALNAALDSEPDVFCATAQIFFPPGIRREETGKTVLRITGPEDFPIRCDDPIPGEDLTYVLYGSGGCSLFDTRKLLALGGVHEAFDPAYVEDLDLGWRAWRRGWATLFAARARVEHRHRATTSRYYSAPQLEDFTDTNYLRFLALSILDPGLRAELAAHALERLRRADRLLSMAARIPRQLATDPVGERDERNFLALTSGDVARFPGLMRSHHPVVIVATPYMPFPLSHGGAVRMYNLMRRAVSNWDQVLIVFVDALAAPPPELLEITREVILVRRHGSHIKRSSDRPDMVEEFDVPAMHAALSRAVAVHRAAIVQLEFTQMAQYAADCHPARTILVEHDLTFDLHQQLLVARNYKPLERYEAELQLKKWRSFEMNAWKTVDRVITMSERDQALAPGSIRLENGVDAHHFQPSDEEPERGRILFIGSFRHLPNLLALEWLLTKVWRGGVPPNVLLHVIAGSEPGAFMRYYDVGELSTLLEQPGIEIEGFVSDVRPAYRRATLIVAPLLASAGTNLKVLEAMAMGKAIVTTRSGINGLAVTESEAWIEDDPARFAAALSHALEDSAVRRQKEVNARGLAAGRYDWYKISERQDGIYRNLSE